MEKTSQDEIVRVLLAREEESALSGGLVRAMTSLLRPLSGVAVLQALLALKFKFLGIAKMSVVVV